MTQNTPRVADNDRDEITVTINNEEIRGWSYANEAERRTKMLAAREFVEGWFQAASLLVPEIIAGIEDHIKHHGDDMGDTGTKRIAELRGLL